jgi:hypothetical protein
MPSLGDNGLRAERRLLSSKGVLDPPVIHSPEFVKVDKS